MANEYDITEAFRRIEEELMASMIRNMKRHRAEEDELGIQWSQWQAEQLKSLNRYKQENQKKYGKQFGSINHGIDELIRQARIDGNMQQEISILTAIKNGFKGAKKIEPGASAEFFRLNDRKLEALIEATQNDMKRAETAVLRMANDQYRKVIFNAHVYANTGAGTYEKAVDMATKDMLASGLNCVEYSNGARHTLSDYADMAIQTASKRAYLAGEGEKRQEWGIATVIVNKRGNPCPKCLPFCGKVLIDDVWSGGSRKDGKYPLMSYAISQGLYHPRCRDAHTTYFPGLSTADDTWTKEELKAVGLANKEEAQEQYAERQTEKFERLAKYSLAPENKIKYSLRAAEWKDRSGVGENKVNIREAHSRFIDRLRSDKHPSLHKDKMAMYSELTDMIEDDNLDVPFSYDPEEDVVKYNSKAPYIKDYDMDYVFAHETSHRMDVLEYHSWENERFCQAVEICQKKVYDNKEQITRWFKPGGKYENSFAISDIVSALTDGEIVGLVGHSKEYWLVPGFKELEIFANISAGDVLNLPEKEEFNGLFKELFEEYEEMVK